MAILTLVEYGRLRKPKAALINVGTKGKPTYLPPEVCKVLPGQMARTKLNPKQMDEFILYVSRGPVQNVKDIEQHGLEIVGLTNKNEKLVGLACNVLRKNSSRST